MNGIRAGDELPFPYRGPAALQAPLLVALHRVVDPEVALTVVDLGLVYGVTIDDAVARVRMTMTSAACPVTEMILDEVQAEVEMVVPVGCEVTVELVWEPAWTPEMMSPRARRFMA